MFQITDVEEYHKSNFNIIDYFREDQFEDYKILLKRMSTILKTLPPVNAAFLGIGDDGHTASIFPDRNNIIIERYPFLITKNPNEVFCRISLSASYIEKIPLLIFIVSGKKKRNIMNDIVNNNSQKNYFPMAKSIIDNAEGSVVILCDKHAFPN